MTRFVRVAGRSRDVAGRLVLWSVAEGARGRRWREAVLHGSAVALARSVTLETDAERRHVKLELAAGVGLVTLHPEPDGQVHGNLVSAHHVMPIAIGIGEVPVFDLPDSVLVTAALCWTLAPLIPVGSRRELIVVRLHVAATDSGGFGVGTEDLQAERPEMGRWLLTGSGLEPREVLIDDDGLPLPPPVVRWPLEAGEPD
jgi:hypothetical protein